MHGGPHVCCTWASPNEQHSMVPCIGAAQGLLPLPLLYTLYCAMEAIPHSSPQDIFCSAELQCWGAWPSRASLATLHESPA